MPVHEVTHTLLRTGRWDGELLRVRRDGREVTVACYLSLQKSENGQPLAKLKTTIDVTQCELGKEAPHGLTQNICRVRFGETCHTFC